MSRSRQASKPGRLPKEDEAIGAESSVLCALSHPRTEIRGVLGIRDPCHVLSQHGVDSSSREVVIMVTAVTTTTAILRASCGLGYPTSSRYLFFYPAQHPLPHLWAPELFSFEQQIIASCLIKSSSNSMKQVVLLPPVVKTRSLSIKQLRKDLPKATQLVSDRPTSIFSVLTISDSSTLMLVCLEHIFDKFEMNTLLL